MISRLGLGAGAMICGFVLSGTAVLAAGVADLVEATDGAIVCWQASVGADVLTGAPERQITELRFAVRHDADVNDHPNYYSFVMEADLVDGRQGRAEGPCDDGDAEGISCGVECDGGLFNIVPGADGTMAIHFRDDASVRMSPACANGGYGDFRLEPVASESPLVLEPMAPAECAASHLAVVYPEPEVD